MPRSLGSSLTLLREQRYRRQFLREDGRQTAVAVTVVAVAYGVAAINDFTLLGGSPLLVVALVARGLHLAATGLALVLLRRARWPRQQDRAFHLALVAMVVSVAVTTLTRIPSGQIQGALIAAGALLAVLYFAQRGPLLPRAVVGSLVVVVGATLVLANPAAAVEPPVRVTSIIALVSLNFVGIVSARAFEEQRRRRFDAELRELQARRELTVKLQELAVEKERAEAMSRARTAFLAAMSHEFRTPMNAVIGLADVLLDAPLAPEHARHVRTISDSARSLLALLNDILDFAKIDAQKLALCQAPFDLRALAGAVVDMLRPAAAARSLALTHELAPDVPAWLVGDDARLRQVLVNLVSNAIKFTERGAVELRISARPHAGEHEVTCVVADTGVGMAPEVVGRLFQPFERADEAQGGTGLGLAISKQIVLAMGGDIWVTSEPGRGSTFTFAIRLPATPSPPPPAPARLARGDRPSLKILVVDDVPINREVAHARLGHLGYAVDLAESGAEAVAAALRTDYDVVFMDLRMPGMNGIEASTRIGERLAGGRAPHIIAMTASVYEEDRDACRRAGMRDFVGKPIDLAQIDAVLARVAEERGVSRAAPAAEATLADDSMARLRRISVPGEPDFFARLCRLFMVDVQERVPRMGDAISRGDARAVEDEAHVLRSTSAALGATEMSTLCGRAEAVAREGRVAELPAILDALRIQMGAVERALVQELARELPSHAVEAS